MKNILSAGTSLPPAHLHLRGKVGRERYSSAGEWTRIAFLGVMLAALWIAVFDDPSNDPPPSDLPPLVEVKTPVPALDQDMLKQVADDSRTSRISVEPAPFLYLVEASLNVVPGVARALGLPTTPVSIPVLRADPDHYRGRYLWYRGVLEETPYTRPGHPVPGYEIHEARLRTPEGEHVLCCFSLPPDSSLREGSWVRMEGFFLKLRDLHLPVRLDRAPMLVGPELFPAFDDWRPVTEIDAKLLAQVHDGRLREEIGDDGKTYRVLAEDRGDSTLPIDRSQSLPLWHLSSYAIEQARGRTYDEANAVPRLMTPPQWRELVRGEAAKGTTYSLIGSLQAARTIEARLNPAGIEYWTEAWIQVRELAGRILPIWIPGRIEGWKPGESALLVGHFFKVMKYTSVADAEHVAPLFVAANLIRYQLPDNPFALYYTLPILGLLVGLMAFTIWIIRRDNRNSDIADAERIARRHRRRAAEPADSVPASPTPPQA